MAKKTIQDVIKENWEGTRARKFSSKSQDLFIGYVVGMSISDSRINKFGIGVMEMFDIVSLMVANGDI